MEWTEPYPVVTCLFETDSLRYDIHEVDRFSDFCDELIWDFLIFLVLINFQTLSTAPGPGLVPKDPL